MNIVNRIVEFWKGTNALVRVTVIIFGVLFLIYLASPPDYYSKGVDSYDTQDWEQAIEYLSLVRANNKNNHNAYEYLTLAKAHKYYHERQWSNVITCLQPDDMYTISTNRKEAKLLRYSAQYYMDRDSIRILIPRLKASIIENQHIDSITTLLISIGNKSNYKKILKSSYSNGSLIAAHVSIIKDIESASESSKELLIEKDKIDMELTEQEAILADIKEQGIIWKSFIIEKQFSIALSETEINDENETSLRNMYSGYSSNDYSEAVVLAQEGVISNNIYERLNLTLLVKPLGARTYRYRNAYGQIYNVYTPTYEVVSKKLNPNIVTAIKNKLMKRKNAIITTLETQNNEIRAEEEKATAKAITELRKSTW